MTFKVLIRTQNAAFSDERGAASRRHALAECARIMSEWADRAENDALDGASGILFDVNGNTVGDWSWSR